MGATRQHFPRESTVGLGNRAEQLVCDHFNGRLAPRGQRGYDLTAEQVGRVQVKARSRASNYLNWFHVRNVHLHEFDYLVLVEFAADGRTVVGAWGMPWTDIAIHAHSTVRSGRGGEITKLAIRGEWKQRAERLRFTSTRPG